LNLKAPTFGEIVPGVFTSVLAKHSKSFSLIDCISVGVDRMQRNFEPMRKQVETWHKSELTDKSPFFATCAEPATIAACSILGNRKRLATG
jgi:hypothetical protein